MRNDTQVKVTCINNEKRQDEFHFDYYDKEGAIVGTVAVDESGRLGWSIWDDTYKDNILYNAAYIFGMKLENSIEYILEAKKPDPIRWDRAQDYISTKGLIVNYYQDTRFSREFKDGSGKRII